jgi:uncharacterized protein YndB with AHSA1/START domain
VRNAAPPERVYEFVVDPRRWKEWSVWNRRDPAMQISYEGAASGVGAVWAWKSATEGDGRMSITAAEPARRLAYDLYFPDFGTTSTGEITLVPEGSGTMMDNTLIVYTSNNADAQHTSGATWPVMLLGNCGGIFKSGCFTQLDGTRPINALYATILKTVGGECERFNMSEKMAAKFDSGTGPLREVLV